MKKVFLSHSTKDRHFVERLAQDLDSRGISVWFSEWEIKVGDSLNDRINTAISESGYLAVILSENSVNSAWVKKELNAALEEELSRRSVFVLPILIDECPIPVLLKDKLYADFRSNYSDGLRTLLRRLLPEKQWHTPPAPQPDIVAADDLKIETDEPYQKLTRYLFNQKLNEADKESQRLIIEASGYDRIDSETKALSIPNELLRRIDELYIKSTGKSVSERRWVGFPSEGITEWTAWYSFKTWLENRLEQIRD